MNSEYKKRGAEASYLDVKRACNSMAYEEISQGLLPRATAVQNSAEPGPKKDESGDFEPESPSTTTCTLGVPKLLEQKAVRVRVQVESRKHHDDIE